MYRVDALRTPSRLRAGYPTLLEGEVRFFQAQDQPSVTTHVRVCNRMFSHSLDVVSKMYIHIIYSAKKVPHRWVFRQILSWPGIVIFNVIYRCLQKSFCNNLMHSKLKSKVPLRNCEHLKRLGVNPQKW